MPFLGQTGVSPSISPSPKRQHQPRHVTGPNDNDKPPKHATSPAPDDADKVAQARPVTASRRQRQSRPTVPAHCPRTTPTNPPTTPRDGSNSNATRRRAVGHRADGGKIVKGNGRGGGCARGQRGSVHPTRRLVSFLFCRQGSVKVRTLPWFFVSFPPPRWCPSLRY